MANKEETPQDQETQVDDSQETEESGPPIKDIRLNEQGEMTVYFEDEEEGDEEIPKELQDDDSLSPSERMARAVKRGEKSGNFEKRYNDLRPHADRLAAENDRLRKTISDRESTMGTMKQQLDTLQTQVAALVSGRGSDSQDDEPDPDSIEGIFGVSEDDFEIAQQDPKLFAKLMRSAIDRGVAARMKGIEPDLRDQKMRENYIRVASQHPDFVQLLPRIKRLIKVLPDDFDVSNAERMYQMAKAMEPSSEDGDDESSDAKPPAEDDQPNKEPESQKKPSAEEIRKRAQRGKTERGDGGAELEEEEKIETVEDAMHAALKELQKHGLDFDFGG